MIRAVLLALLLAGVVAAPAQAGAREDAKRLARLHTAYDRGAQARTEAFEREFDAELGACPAQPPTEAMAEDRSQRLVSLHLRGAIARSAVQLERMGRALKRFRTRDRVLRRLAHAMGRSTVLVGELAKSPPRVCPYLEAWKASGWAPDFRISPPVRNFTAAEVTSLRRDARIVRRATPRLRRLGVPLRVRRDIRGSWSGDELYGQLAL